MMSVALRDNAVDAASADTINFTGRNRSHIFKTFHSAGTLKAAAQGEDKISHLGRLALS